jgi:uncharacterized protein (UPF0335 family)
MPADEVTDAARHADNQARLEELERQQTETKASIEQLVKDLAKLGIDVHAMKGNVAAGARMGQETLDGVAAIRSLFAQLDVPALREMADAMNSMKGGVRVLGWLERPAKWIAAIAGAVLALYGIFKLKG